MLVTPVTSIGLLRLFAYSCPVSVRMGTCLRVSVPNLIMSKVALVVDDSMLIRYSVCRFLEERGFVVETAINGSEALDKLSRVKPDLIVTDMKMPKMSGSELITALKSRAETAHVPIVVITSNVNGCADAEKRADFAIYKNIEIESQLEKALSTLPGMTNARGQSAR